MDSVLQSSKAFVRDQRVFQGHVIEDPHMQPEDLDEDPTTVYYGGEVYSTNGLYVVNPPAPGTRGLDPAGIPSSAVHDNYGFLPSPPPVPPGPPHSTRYLYPENAGHLVWTSLNLFGPVWEGVAAIWFEPRPLPIQDFFFWFPRQMCQLYCSWQQQFYFPFFMNFKNSIVKSWSLSCKSASWKYLREFIFYSMYHIMKKISTFLISDQKKQIIQECDQNSDREKAADFSWCACIFWVDFQPKSQLLKIFVVVRNKNFIYQKITSITFVCIMYCRMCIIT